MNSFENRLVNRLQKKRGGISIIEPGKENKFKQTLEQSQEIEVWTDDHIYYNFTVKNPITNTVSIPASYSVTLNEAIINNPSEYHLSVIRMFFNGQDFPIFKFQTLPGSTITGIYSVSLAYSGFNYQTYLANPTQSGDVNFYIYDYQTMLTAINTALTTSYNNLKTQFSGSPPSHPPYIALDPSNQFFSMNGDPGYDLSNSSNNPPVYIYMNWPLYQFFGTFPAFFKGYNLSGGDDIYMLMQNNGGSGYWNLLNPPYTGSTYTYTGITLDQEISQIEKWNIFNTIILQSQNLRVKQEYLPSSGNNSQIPIITDFVPQPTNGSLRTNLQYIPSAEYRLLDLIGQIPLKNIDVSLAIQDQSANIIPVNLSPGGFLSGKLLFRKKSKLGPT